MLFLKNEGLLTEYYNPNSVNTEIQWRFLQLIFPGEDAQALRWFQAVQGDHEWGNPRTVLRNSVSTRQTLVSRQQQRKLETCGAGPPYFLSAGHIRYYTTVRVPDILRNKIVSGYVRTFYQIIKLFVNILFFHYWQNVFGDRIWSSGRSSEILDQEQ